jgi:hypothetical protein
VLHKSGCARVAIGDSVYRALVFVRSCLSAFRHITNRDLEKHCVRCAARRPQVKQALRITSFMESMISLLLDVDLLVIRIGLRIRIV